MWDMIIVNPMINILLLIYNFVSDFGIAIILFTILIRLVTHPLMAKQIKGAAAMQEFQNSDKWKAVQKKYKDDKEKLAQEQMALYKELGISPFDSCLPMLIQLPVIFGLYQALIKALAVTPLNLLNLSTRIYPWINGSDLIPLDSTFLWMNLSQPERLNIFGVGVPILTILVVITTFLQQKMMTPANPNASPTDQSAQMSKMMNIYMPLFMGYIALTLASGLAIYFVVSNLVGIGQYAALGKLNWRNIIPSFASNKAKK
jgi:YidC/Oxa1 family membrane protein insertase